MAFKLNLFYQSATAGSATQLDISSYVQFYTPVSAPYNTERITEQLQIRLPVGLSAARAKMVEIENYLRRAREADQMQTTPRVWVEFTPDGTEEGFVAQLFGGTLQPTDGTLTKAQNNFDIYDFVLTWEREAYWTDDDDEQIVYYSSDVYKGSGYNNDTDDWFIYNSAHRTVVTNEVLAAADGILTSFSGTTANANIYHARSTPVFKYNIGGVLTYTYDQLKTLASGTTKVSSVTFNFLTGAWAITFTSPPANGTNITLSYTYGYGNWIEVIGESGPTSSTRSFTVSGDLPGLPLINATNLDTTDIDQIWIGCLNALGPGAFPELWYEAEDADYSDSSGALQSDVSLSGGSQIAWTVTTSEAVLLDWLIDDQDIAYMAGKWFAPILRYGKDADTGIANVLIRWEVYTDSAGSRDTLVFQSDQYRPADTDKRLHQLGTVQLPPWSLRKFSVIDAATNGTNMHLVLKAQAVGSDQGLAIDALQLMPTDWFCKLEYRGGAIEQNDNLLFDCYDRIATVTPTGTTDSNRAILVLHDMPTLDPTRDQRWFFVWTSSTAYTAPIDADMDIAISMYARRRVI